MRTTDAAHLARRLIAEHLPGLGWTFQFDNAKTRFGQCRYRTQTISISEPLTRLNEEDIVRDTILHEIAHAIAGPKAGHGPVWRAHARRIGCKAERCFDGDEVATPDAAWIGTCPNGHTQKRHRLTAKAHRVACAQCCNRFNGGRFSAEYKFVWAAA